MKTLIIMRGLPGSGKSTKASSFGGKKLSTDDYFSVNGKHQFDPSKLTEAHEWNQNRTEKAMVLSEPIIVIDNTNTQFWEMQPYVKLAFQYGYNIEFHSPNTRWAWDEKILTEKNTHGVPLEVIERMKHFYQHDATIYKIVNSQNPFEVRK